MIETKIQERTDRYTFCQCKYVPCSCCYIYEITFYALKFCKNRISFTQRLNHIKLLVLIAFSFMNFLYLPEKKKRRKLKMEEEHTSTPEFKLITKTKSMHSNGSNTSSI